jgi:predicted transglutaminase-like cysteine proteinase
LHYIGVSTQTLRRLLLNHCRHHGLFLLLVSFILLFGVCVLALETDFHRMRIVAGERFGAKGLQAVEDWQSFLNKTAGEPLTVRLKRVNDFINLRTQYVEDYRLWGENDYWATPLETLGGGAGDCEDFALAKYLSLRVLGVPAASMRLTYVRAQIPDLTPQKTRAHMVVSYYPANRGEPLILDSLVAAILPASQRPDLKPVFSFNSEALWVPGRPDLIADPTARLSHWRDVVARMGKEGTIW